ncbi:MAG: hypothetical protein Q9P44_15845 [Anaerolineae bacterium]|nr:hypothetical protein [Anaerolineae bacterium]
MNRNRLPELSANDAELLSAYIDDMLSAADRDALEKRLNDDAFLRHELQVLRRTVNWLNHMPTLQAPRNFTIRAEDIAQDPPPNVLLMPRRNGWLSVAAAAVIVLLFGAVFVFSSLSTQNSNAPLANEAADSASARIVEEQDSVAQIAALSTAVPDSASSDEARSLDIADDGDNAGASAEEAESVLADSQEATTNDVAIAPPSVEDARAATIMDVTPQAETIFIEASPSAPMAIAAATEVSPPIDESASDAESNQPNSLGNVEITATALVELVESDDVAADADMEMDTMATGDSLPETGGGISQSTQERQSYLLRMSQFFYNLFLDYLDSRRSAP